MTYTFVYRPFAEALYDALLEDAFYQTLERSVGEGDPREAMLRYLDYSMVEAERYGALFTSDGPDCGAAIWAKPLAVEAAAEKHRRKLAFLDTHMGPRSRSTYAAICERMASAAQPLIAADAWYLSILGMLPEYQGRGLGAGLVAGILAEADGAGVATYLETFTAGTIGFYQRLGYRVAGRFRESTTGADYWLMSRGAGGSA